MKNTNIIIIGGGGHAKSVISILHNIPKYKIVGYISPEDQNKILGIEYLGTDHILQQKPAAHAVIALGNQGKTDIIRKLTKYMLKLGYIFPSIISPSAIVAQDVEIEQGTIVMNGTILNSGCKIGAFSVINTRASIDHDSQVGDYCHIAPGCTLCGNINIKNNIFVGAGSTIIPNITINNDCIIGAGSTVIDNCEKPGLYLGSPAKKRT